jgi:hypothetical protein
MLGAKITGNIYRVTQQPAMLTVLLVPVTLGIVQDGGLIAPEVLSVAANDVGYFETFLARGSYELSVSTRSGLTARVTINVPNDGATYNFEALVVSDLPDPQPPTGSGQPTASPGNLGLVKVDTADADPVAVLGFFVKQTLAQMKAIPSRQSVKFVMLRNATREPGAALLYSFTFGDASAADGFNVVAPDDGGGRYFAEA